MVYELIISIEHERRWLCAYDLWCGYVKYLPFCISHSLDAEMLVLHYFQVTHECKCTAYIQHTEGLLWWLLLFISRLDCTMPGHCRRGSFVVCAPHTHTLTPRKNWQEESNPICPVHEWESEREREYIITKAFCLRQSAAATTAAVCNWIAATAVSTIKPQCFGLNQSGRTRTAFFCCCCCFALL